MAINDLVRDTESAQYFPQIAMPDSTFETMPALTVQDDTYLDKEHDQNYEMDNHIIGALKECLEEIDFKAKELFKKIVDNDYVEMTLGRLAREAIGEAGSKDFLGKIVTKVINKMKAQGDDVVVGNRGISIDDELSQKLERFKVKTVNIGGGVVKEDNK